MNVSDVAETSSSQRVAVLSDIHGNIHALRAVLNEVDAEGISRLIVLGDTVGYGANPRECLAMTSRAEIQLMGNHEWALSAGFDDLNDVAADSLSWTREQLDQNTLKQLAKLPLKAKIGEVELTHGSLESGNPWGYLWSPAVAAAHLRHQSALICLSGHCHLLFGWEENNDNGPKSVPANICRPERKTVVCVGSVGQPRDGDARASWAVLDTAKSTVNPRRTSYDTRAAADAIINAGLPAMLAERIIQGR